jgi:hypothetical protein
MMGELLLLIILGVILWLVNVVLPAWMQRQQRDAARDVGPPGLPEGQHSRRLPPAREAVRPGFPVPVVEPRVAIRQRALVRLGSRRDVRRAIVLMTILGPCRALDPPDPAR